MKHIALAFFISIVSKSAISSTPSQPKPSIDIGITESLNSLHPYRTYTKKHPFLHHFVHRQLVDLNEEWQWACDLCEKIPTQDNGGFEEKKSGKQTQYLIHWQLKSTAKWGDGTPITASDVVFSWRVAKTMANRFPNFRVHQDIETVKLHETNPNLVTFVMMNMEYDYIKAAQFPILPSIHEEEIFNKFIDDIDSYFKYSKYSQSPKLPSLYSGPFVPTGWQKNLWTTLGRAGITDREKKSGPFSIKVHSLQSEKAIIAGLKTGKINFVPEHILTQSKIDELFGPGPLYVPYKQALVSMSTPTDSLEQLTINLRNPVLADNRVRSALWLALQNSKLFKKAGIGDIQSASSFIHPLDTYSASPLLAQSADLTAANRLLDKAGWEKKGQTRKKGGKSLQLTIATNKSDSKRRSLAKEIAKQWAQIGVVVEVKTYPDDEFFTSTIRRALFPDFALFAWKLPPNTPPRVLFHSKNIPDQNNGYNGKNIGGWRNRTVDQALDGLTVELDQQKRAELYGVISREFVKDIPLLPLYHQQRAMLIPQWLEGVRWGGHNTPSSFTAERWRLKSPVK